MSWVLRGRTADAESPTGFLPPHYWHVEDANGRFIATFPQLVVSAQEQQAKDAFQIVAVPELLAALKQGVAIQEGTAYGKNAKDHTVIRVIDEWLKQANAAIAKATGSAS